MFIELREGLLEYEKASLTHAEAGWQVPMASHGTTASAGTAEAFGG